MRNVSCFLLLVERFSQSAVLNSAKKERKKGGAENYSIGPKIIGKAEYSLPVGETKLRSTIDARLELASYVSPVSPSHQVSTKRSVRSCAAQPCQWAAAWYVVTLIAHKVSIPASFERAEVSSRADDKPGTPKEKKGAKRGRGKRREERGQHGQGSPGTPRQLG